MFGQDNSVVQLDHVNYEYARTVQVFTKETLASGATSDNDFVLKANYDEMIGIAVYDGSADVFAFSLGVRSGNGEVLQDVTPRKSWVFTGSNSQDSQMPESHHYKMINLDYDKTGDKTLSFQISNLSGTAFASTLLLYVVVLSKRIRKPS